MPGAMGYKLLAQERAHRAREKKKIEKTIKTLQNLY